MVNSYLGDLTGIWQLLPKKRHCSGCDRQRRIDVSSDIDGTTDAQFDTYRNLGRREIAVVSVVLALAGAGRSGTGFREESRWQKAMSK
jgi:hypothetical protein